MDIQPSTESSSDPVVEFARANRATVGYILLVPAVLCLVLTLVLGYKGFRSGPKPEAPAGEKGQTSELPKSVANPNAPDYLWGFVFAAAATLPLLGVGVWFVYGAVAADAGMERTHIRIAVLAAGGLFGIALMLGGLVFFIRWVDGLIAWLDGRGAADLRWSVSALVLVVLGAGALFLAIQPARAEERNNVLLRRLVYGSNLALVLLLLAAVLLAGNVIAAEKVPNQLDTTESGFYTLSPETENFLKQLDQPVTAYAILGDRERASARTVDDVRRMLLKCQDVSDGKFTVRIIGLTTGTSEYERLKTKYPDVELNGLGVLLTAGEDEKRHAFIRLDDFFSFQGQGRQSRMSFVGESRLLRDLAYLVENTTKPIVYFTQSNGELEISEAPRKAERSPPEATAHRLKDYLEKNHMEVRALEFKLGQTAVPADAAAVVVAQPTSPFGKEAEAALRRYMKEPRGNKKGKLVMLSGTPFPPGGPVPRTGLEDLLRDFNIELGDKYLYGEGTDNVLPGSSIVVVNRPAIRAGNPVAKAFALIGMSLPACRVVDRSQTYPEFLAVPVLITQSGRYTWFEDTPPADPEQVWVDLKKSAALRKQKSLSESPRIVAVFTSETTPGQENANGPGRIAAFGNSLFISDMYAQASRGQTPKTFELLGGTLDWLRDRPTIAPGIAGKVYSEYHINPGLDGTRLFWVPLGLGILAVAGVGAGVWTIRRK